MRRHLTLRQSSDVSRPLAAGLVALFSLLTVPSDGAAQMADDVSDKAKRHYQQGVELYKNEQFGRAATELRTAYSLAPSPLLLYNVAMAEWRSGDLDSALATAYRVLDDGLKGEMQPTLQGRVRGFERIERARDQAEAYDPTVTEARSSPTESSEGDNFGTAGWVAIATGSAGAISLFGALSLDRAIASDVDSFEQAARRGDASVYRRDLNDLQKRQTIGRLLLVGGTALLATSAGFTIAELADTSETEPAQRSARAFPLRISVTPSPDGFVGTFSIDFR